MINLLIIFRKFLIIKKENKKEKIYCFLIFWQNLLQIILVFAL